MIPMIALDLSLDGIVVMSRAASGPDLGKWWREGVVHLDDEDMTAALQRMRAICAARVGENFTSILVIPASQLLFTSLERDDRDARTTIRSLLEDRTPYPVDDLVFDFVPRGDRLQVAVVARDTLQEAEAFAAGFGFRPVAFVGHPVDGAYPGVPQFGQTRLAPDLLGGATLTLDLGEGFDVVPAPALPDLPAAGTSADASGPGEPPAQQAPVAGPDTMIPPGALGEEAAGPPPVEPGGLPEDPSDFASVMAAAPASAPTPAERSLDTAGRAADPRVGSGDAETDRSGASGQEATTSPAFATRRRTAGAARTEPGLTRISPRLSPTGLEDGPARSVDDTPGKVASSRLSPRMGGTGRAPAGAKREEPGPEEAGDEAAPPPKRRTSGRLGLYLTLSLLVLLGLLALWSVTVRDEGVASRAATGGISSAVDLPVPAPSRAQPPTAEPEVAAARSAPPESDATPRHADPVEDDLALLLPDSEGSAAPVDMGTSEPPSPAEPVAAEDEAADASAPADAVPEITVVTTDAEPFELPRDIADAPEAESADDIYVASIDPVISGSDAVALPRAAPPADTFSPQTSPAPAGTAFVTGNDGLAVASAEGTLAPGGYRVIAGRPATLPIPRPVERAGQQAAEEAAEGAARAELGRIRPVPRPDDAPERAERLSFNGLTRAELTRTPPVRRPASIAQAAARAEGASARQAAAVQAAASAAVASLAQTEPPAGLPEPDAGLGAGTLPPSQYALAQSFRPRERPRSVEQDAARIVTQRQPPPAATAVASPGAGSTTPPARVESSPQTIRSAGGSVSRAATQSNQIRLREMNLIGVYGRANARRALVRLSNGRYVKIEVGDRLERGRVIAIGESEVIYQQNGRNYALRLPQT